MLTESQSLVQESVRAFAQDNILPNTTDYERAGKYPEALFKELGALGLMGMTAPELYGGSASDNVSYALALIEIAAADGALSTILSIQNSLIVGGILQYGDDRQKADYLPKLISGEMIGAFALTEADAGSDAAAIRTRATKSPEGWILNGSKQFISSGQICGLAMVTASTDPQAGKQGFSCFLVERDTPGFIVEKVEHKLGQQASDTCALRFEDMAVGDGAMMGAEGQGYRMALANLETGRIGIAAQCVGMAQAAFDIALRYAKERQSFGKAIFEHQAVGFRLADLATKLEAARQMVLHAARLKDAKVPCLKEACMAKLFASEIVEEVASGAVQTLGGYGYLEEYGLAKIYRDQRVCQIYEGTSDIQKMIISRAL